MRLPPSIIGLLTLTSCTWLVDPTCGVCPGNLTCLPSGACRPVCEQSSDCINGFYCSDEVCVLGCEFDADADEVCDAEDICEGFDDAIDTDMDGRPDDCDTCPLDHDGNPDVDNDGSCNADDICDGEDDFLDTDSDGLPNGCDLCPDQVGEPDADDDQVCDAVDVCDGSDDRVDRDANNQPDCTQPDLLRWPFDDDTTDWSPGEWNSSDAGGVWTSGSLKLESTTEFGTHSNGPCIRVRPGTDYTVMYDLRVRQEVDMLVQVSVIIWTETDCSNDFPSYSWTLVEDPARSWSTSGFQFTAANPHTTTQIRSARLQFSTGPRPLQTGAYFDNITVFD